LYAYVRRRGQAAHDAQDLTQEFFARLLAKDWLRAAAREKGRFRTFLLVAMQRFLANEWDRASAQKRGGGEVPVSLDTAQAEERYAAEPVDARGPDHVFERRWALTLLEQALSRLRVEYEREGQGKEFQELKQFLTADRGTIPYANVASALGVSEGTARVAVHRLRKRFRACFRGTIADTVADPAEVEDEVRLVARLLSEG
jgi:RNA polymerase sigma-70 factor (ECF subfamily)